MAKITLSNIGTGTAFQTAITTVNSNNDAIETAFENTLSRDGTTPNTMQSNLDMNSYRLMNLPTPTNASEPLRLGDITDVDGTFITASTGTSGHHVPYLDGNNTWSGTNTFSAASTFNGQATLVAPILGTPASATLTNATGLPVTGIAGLGTGVATFLATPSSANFASAVTGETGSGAVMFGTGPTMSDPTITGTATAPTIVGGSAVGSALTLNGTSNGSPSSSYVLIQTNGQRVGIGQSTPQTVLHIGPGSDAPNLSSAQMFISNTGTAAFAVRDATNDIEFGMFTNHTPDIVALGSRTNHPVWIQTNGANTHAFHVSGGFSVGSTTDPGSNSLSVAGAATVSGVATLASGTATPAGGSTSARLLLGTTAGFGIYYGSGAPTVSAASGSIYIRTDNAGANLRIYSNTTGSTTWAAVTSA